MQTVNSAWTAEERDTVRKIAHNLQVSWKKDSILGNRTFTIGVSTIGGSDIIGINPGAIGSPGNYRYFDESAYVTSLAWERGLNMPTGGLVKALGEATLDNTNGRFLPRYMGGNSELFTAILPRKPAIIGAGFNFSGIDQTVPQLSGILNKAPVVDVRNREVSLQMEDYIGYFQNRFLDQSIMFTAQRTDEVMRTLLVNELGMSTAQFSLDDGINLIPFGMFEKGRKFYDIFNDLTQAENGHSYMDEAGIFHFENRQHWDASPYNQTQRVIHTAQVIDAQAPDTDHIINVVEIRSKIMEKQPEQIIYRLNPFDSLAIPANSSAEYFFEFESPALSMTTPTGTGTVSYFVANDMDDGSGTDLTSSVSVTYAYRFANSTKMTFTNSSSSIAYITTLVISGRSAKSVGDLYTRSQISSSVTAYEERKFELENQFIQNVDWANSYAQMILNDFAQPENLQRITIRAIPELQLGDLVSWQGRPWRVFDIKSRLSPGTGFTQELTLLQRTITTYFRIGISTIGGSDKIAP